MVFDKINIKFDLLKYKNKFSKYILDLNREIILGGKRMEDRLKQGLVQVYTGGGKGKTTAALGLGLRASGHGFKVEMIQFLKGTGYTGELKAVKDIEEITVKQYGKPDFIVNRDAKKEDHMEAEKAFHRAEKAILEEDWDIIILDELNLSIYFDLIKIEDVLELMDKVRNTEVIITGRNADEKLIEKADLVTSMEEIKHPYQEGFTARKGIEY